MLFLFGLVTEGCCYTDNFGEWRLVQQSIKRWSKNVLRMSDVQSVANGDRRTLKLDYASVIFVDVAVQIHKT